jgi:hypothetical protein
MADPMTEAPDPGLLRQKALARWDTEGGAGPDGPQRHEMPSDVIDDLSAPTDAELVQLRIRVIALENLVIALLAEATNAQRTLARDLAAHISPRPESTQHPLTIHAARHMLNMVERAEHFGATETACHHVSSTPP